MRKTIEPSCHSVEPLHHSLPPQRKKISETLEQAPDQELILPGHNKATCWKILNEKVFDTGLFDILRFKQINASICGNSNKYHHLNKIFGSVSYQKANKQIHFFSKKFCKLKKELQALSEELLPMAKEKKRRKEMTAGLKNSSDGPEIYCMFPDGRVDKEEGVKPKSRRTRKKKIGRPRDKDVVPLRAKKTKEELTAYITEIDAKHGKNLDPRATLECMGEDGNEKKSIREIIRICNRDDKYLDALWKRCLISKIPEISKKTDSAQHEADLLETPESIDDEMLDPPDNFVETLIARSITTQQ